MPAQVGTIAFLIKLKGIMRGEFFNLSVRQYQPLAHSKAGLMIWELGQDVFEDNISLLRHLKGKFDTDLARQRAAMPGL